MSGFKNPQALGSASSYDVWKTETSMWQTLTDLQPSKRELAVALALTGSAREDAMSNDEIRYNRDDGVKILLEDLDK